MATFGTWSSGDVLTAADLNTGMPACVLRKSSQSIPNATITTFTFGSGEEVHDPYDWHSTATNTDRITPDIAGIYLVVFNMNNVAGSMSGRLLIAIRKNGTDFGRFDVTPTAVEGATVTGIINANGTTDYFDCFAFQSSGGAKTFNAPTFSAVRIAG